MGFRFGKFRLHVEGFPIGGDYLRLSGFDGLQVVYLFVGCKIRVRSFGFEF